ncbi:TrkA family potassium uptake protein [Proteiniclasticum sp. BAD-10]|uniref:TrkA family potassium uptake protein n=1 Tax=Proteiniclasticum sediminis TaxID=2804028 RepID=A0A941HPA8_9CLOT|nr:TrkA family potassium uptake protein [Proteiniclasticum sediminis]MBR0574870.1 TrkA family potassium uptake protein [Proteiniclasticum sediminis]
MKSKQFVVIGLGKFGQSVAKTLFQMGYDVLAVDDDETIVQEISDQVTHAVQMDATDEYALRTLGIRNFDVAVVSIGSNIQSSIMVTLNLKEAGVKKVIAKGNNEMHAKLLSKIGADKVIQPEMDMGIRVAHNLVSSSILDFIELSPDYSIIEVATPREWVGKDIAALDARAKYGINIMAIKSQDNINVSPRATDVIQESDVLVVIGATSDLSTLEALTANE